MRLLVLGGTVFLGRHVVSAAADRGHEVSLFNRGRSGPDLFPGIERLIGDRDGGLDALDGRRWDAVIDTCGYVPRIVKASAEVLAEAADHYTFVSSISVYEDSAKAPIDESAAVGTLDDATVETIDGQTYGPLKALCETAAEAAMPGRVLNLRPGLIVGPFDPTDRFTYWPWRVARGGDCLLPDGPDALTQIIDVRDLAEWAVRAVEEGVVGPHNATGPAEPLSLGQIFEACKAVTGSDARARWCDEAALIEAGVRPFLDLPLWVPREQRASMQVDCTRAIDAGLRFRPLAATIADTLAWAEVARPEGMQRAGLSPEREVELLAML